MVGRSTIRSAICLALVLFLVPLRSFASGGGANLAQENSIVASLQARSLIGGTLTEDSPAAVIPSPPPGTEVRVYDAGRADRPLDATMTEWEEPFGTNILAFT